MLFGNKNKIKKRVLKSVDERAVGLARRGKTEKAASPIWRKIGVVFLVLIFIGSTIFLLFFSPFLLVTKINISGAQDLDASSLRSVASSVMAGRYFNAIAKDNLILVSDQKVKLALLDKFKRIEEVQVSKKFPDTLEIKIKERKSMLVLCCAGACFIIDNSGVSYAAADFASNELQENNLIVIVDDSGKTIELGEKMLDPAYMKYLLDIKENLKSDLSIEIDKTYHTPQLVSGDIRATTADGWQIYFDSNLSIQKELDALKLVLSEKVGEENKDKLEYVDLRTENKVYYKLKNVEPVQPAVEEAKKDDANKDKKK